MPEEVLAALQEYFDAFNDHDIDKTLSFLDEAVEVFIEGAQVAAGRDTIKQSYVSDFEAGKQVKVKQDAKVIEQDDTVAKIAVGLSTGQVNLDCVYTVRLADKKQVRHEISNIVKLEERHSPA